MTMPRRHRHGRHQQAVAITAMLNVAPVVKRIEELFVVAADWSPGFGSGQADVKVSGGGNDGSPAPPGTWQTRHVEELDAACRALVAACDRLGALGVDLLHRSTDTGRRATVAPCATCGRIVAGTEQDRLRAGMCDRCRKGVERLALEHPDMDRWDRVQAWKRRIADEAETGTPAVDNLSPLD
jgi:endogenous inhibitor of DNA gyrase (YacG/DUF329 family)